MEARINNIDDRVARMETQMTSLATSMQQFAEGMTTLVRVDERVAQLLIENRNMGERLGRTQDAMQTIQLDVAELKVEVDALQNSKKDISATIGKALFYLISMAIAIILARNGVNIGVVS